MKKIYAKLKEMNFKIVDEWKTSKKFFLFAETEKYKILITKTYKGYSIRISEKEDGMITIYLCTDVKTKMMQEFVFSKLK